MSGGDIAGIISAVFAGVAAIISAVNQRTLRTVNGTPKLGEAVSELHEAANLNDQPKP